MSLIIIDEDKCQHDGICAAVCPGGLIELKGQERIPTPVEGAEEYCITCGHCVAACPSGALSHQAMAVEQCPPLRRELSLSPEQAAQFLRARRSVRNYQDQPVAREVILKLIHLASYAPSGHNLQPVEWLVIHDTDRVRSLAGEVVEWMRHLIKQKSSLAETLHMDRTVAAWESGVERVCRGAPHVVVAHAPQGERTAPMACAIALTYLELAAFSFGLGACWAGYFNLAANTWPPMKEALGLPGGHSSFGAMMLGHPKYRYHLLPRRKEPEVQWG